MAGADIRIFTDEHIFRDLARELRRRGFDAAWKAAGREHAGIILVAGSPGTFGDLLRRVERHL